MPLRPPELRPPPPPATKLELRSLLRTTKRTVAVINNERFEPGAEIPLLINGQRHRVRLESVEDNAVTVTVDGADYAYTAGSNDTANTVRDAIVALVAADSGAPVTAAAATMTGLIRMVRPVGLP